MKYYIKLSLLLFSCWLQAKPQQVYHKEVQLKSVDTFFSKNQKINKNKIDWYRFQVPENWDKVSENNIQLAVAYIHSYNKTDQSMVFLSGGPGGWSIGAIKKWLKHPIREHVNIILMDLRGTGFSEPLLCPDYGEELFEIFSKNNSSEEEINAIENLSLTCYDDIKERNIDLKSYSSENVSHDLHALKEQLKIKEWSVYGVSYGTYIAQKYLANYPSDISKVILDSPIAETQDYYGQNTQNFLHSLELLFKESKSKYPNLKDTYNNVIEELINNPITVKVKRNIVSSGVFTFNKEDFKLIIQQCLYKKESIEAIPSIIGAFYERNKSVLSKLVDAFSSKLKRDYGTYYCMTCNDMFTKNMVEDFDVVPEGLAYYKSDLKICEKWNLNKLETAKDNEFSYDKPVLIIAGKYDPITPVMNGRKIEKKYVNVTFFEMPYGHGTGFSKQGKTIVSNFLNGDTLEKDLSKDSSSINFFNNVHKNEGIGNFVNEVIRPDFLFLSPLIIAVFILLITVISYSIKLFKKGTKEKLLKNVLLCLSFLMCIILGSIVFAISQVAQQNFYLLLFGVPEKFEFIFWLKYPLFCVFAAGLAVFAYKMKNIKTREVYSTVLFSVGLILVYFMYWGIF